MGRAETLPGDRGLSPVADFLFGETIIFFRPGVYPAQYTIG